ncbi:MAG: hypothetical protein HYV95_03700 [Opitutae bacterium]|nr:hypothetical protein [Opitutae bacterium]
MGSTRATELPAPIWQYRPASLPNGCFVEAVVFADWYMTKEFDGPKTWAKPVFITAWVGSRSFAHAVAIFQWRGRYYLWDAEWGAMPLRMDRYKGRPGITLAGFAELTYRDALEGKLAKAQQGPAPQPLLHLSWPPGLDVLGWAEQRLGSTRPTFRLVIATPDGERRMLGFVVQEEMFLYNEEKGTVGGKITGDPTKHLHELARRIYPQVKDIRLSALKTPAQGAAGSGR